MLLGCAALHTAAKIITISYEHPAKRASLCVFVVLCTNLSSPRVRTKGGGRLPSLQPRSPEFTDNRCEDRESLP
jgi:hypothetical protein